MDVLHTNTMYKNSMKTTVNTLHYANIDNKIYMKFSIHKFAVWWHYNSNNTNSCHTKIISINKHTAGTLCNNKVMDK